MSTEVVWLGIAIPLWQGIIRLAQCGCQLLAGRTWFPVSSVPFFTSR